MKLTTKAIIQILPFEDEFRKQFLADFDLLSPDQKFNIVQIIWDAYGGLYKIRLDKNTREALVLAEEGKEKLDKQFYQRIKDKTNKEMQKQIAQSEINIDLSDTREELEKIIKNVN